MELKEFTKTVILEIVNAVEEARGEASRDMKLESTSGTRTIEFDIAVSAEDGNGKEGSAGIKVWQVLEGGGKISSESKNSTVTRIKFGVHVDSMNKDEQARLDASNKEWERQQREEE